MKRLLISIFMLSLAHVGVINAANTDISSLDNIIYLEPVSAEAGDQVVLSFIMKNSALVAGFQFDLYLPEGVTVVDESQKLNADRIPVNSQSLGCQVQSDGAYRFLSGNQDLKTFKGTDGEVFTAVIDIPSSLTLGDHAINLKNMTLSDGKDGSYPTENIETTLTITGISDGTVKLNENSKTLPVEKTEATVKVIRPLVKGTWNTLCLPFKMTKNQVENTFGEGTLVCTLYSVEEDGDDFIVNFKSRTTSASMIQANTPVIIKPAKEITDFTLTGIDITAPQALIEKTNEEDVECKFYGTEIAGKIIPENHLFINSGNFYYSKGTTTIKAFRAYLYIYGFDYNAAPALTINVDGEATRIDDLEILSNDGRIYNLKGQHVESPTDKGVYIKNGKKFVVK